MWNRRGRPRKMRNNRIMEMGKSKKNRTITETNRLANEELESLCRKNASRTLTLNNWKEKYEFKQERCILPLIDI